MFLSDGAIVPDAVSTLADRTPLFADASYYGTNSLQMVGAWAAYAGLYRHQLWIQTVIRKLGTGTARIPLDVKLRDGQNSTDEDGPLAALLERPNSRLSGYQLKWWTASTRDIYGEAFWLKLRDQYGAVRELHPMNPTNVIVRRVAGTDRVEYIYTSGTLNTSVLPPIPQEDVVAFVDFNPDNLARGLSRLEALRATLQNEDASRRATSSFWARGAQPSLIITHPKSLSQGAKDRLKSGFDARHAGADKMGGTSILEEGMTAQQLQLTNEQMQYIESRKLNREEVCAAFDVPPPVVHILDNATYSNITEQMRSQYRDTMAPRFSDYESILNHQLVPDFYGTGQAFVRFNMDEVLRGDFEARAAAAVNLRNSGLLTGNEIRPMFGYPTSPSPEMNKIFANAALTELGKPQEKISASGDGGAALIDGQPPASSVPLAVTDTAPKGYTGASAPVPSYRAVMGTLSRVKGKQGEQRQKLVDEHRKALRGFFDAQATDIKAKLGGKAAGAFDPRHWDTNLTKILLELGKAAAKISGDNVADILDGIYDDEALQDWLYTNASIGAGAINDATAAELAQRWADNVEQDVSKSDVVDDMFGDFMGARADQIAGTRVTEVSGKAAQESAEQNDAGTKTWQVNSTNPRPTHQAVDGETVAADDYFSNGMLHPGDWSGGADEVSGCQCTITYSKDSE